MSFDFIARKFAQPAPLVCKSVEWEEGGDCPACKAPSSVVIAYPEESCCSCHINPPCGRCTSSFHQCTLCGEDDRD